MVRNVDCWLLLDDFDNCEYDIRTAEEWMQSRFDEETGAELPLKAKALRALTARNLTPGP